MLPTHGVYVYDSIEIDDDVFIGPNVTFTNDIYPRSQRENQRLGGEYPKTKIGKGASIGGGATILPGVTIAESAIVGAGSVVVKDVKAGAIVYGDAAKFRRDINTIPCETICLYYPTRPSSTGSWIMRPIKFLRARNEN